MVVSLGIMVTIIFMRSQRASTMLLLSRTITETSLLMRTLTDSVFTGSTPAI